MQKLILLIIVTITAIFVKGQNLEAKTISLESFDKINSDMVFSVEIVKSNEEKAVIKSNYLQFVDVSVKNNVLKIGYKGNKSMENVDTRIVIYAKDVKSVSAGIGSIVKIKDNFNIQKFSTESGGKIFGDSNAKNIMIETESGGSFLGTINTENLVLNAQSGSKIDIQGKIDTAKITSEGASKIIATKTNISVATVNAESASSVNLSISKELKASASSMAKIRYKTLSGIKFSGDRDSGGTIDML
ncbi:GIN domain-containing protein [Epilithonimonas sp. UC225_85]|uniref:GIN domain-containing protein n=1 Tax=Epilithonimonas sp. UC225_85 TaxID=3350167 RepID=UPI0036D30D02